MAESPELPEPAPWKKNLRLLRRREVKKREEDAKSRNIEVELFEDISKNTNVQQRVQTPVQRYAHESFEKGTKKPTTPHFDAGRYSTPPRTRSPKRRSLADDAELLQDLSDSLIRRRSRENSALNLVGNDDSPSMIYTEEVDKDSEVEIGSGSSERDNDIVLTKDDRHPFKVAVSPLPVKASVDILRERDDANNSLVDDTKGIMDEGVVWGDDEGKVKDHSQTGINIISENKQHGSLPRIKRMKMDANGPTPGSKILFPKIDALTDTPTSNTYSNMPVNDKSKMKQMLGSLQKRKKTQRTKNTISTPSTSIVGERSPIPSSHNRQKLKLELEASEGKENKPVRRRRTRIRDAMHEYVASDISSENSSTHNNTNDGEHEGGKTTVDERKVEYNDDCEEEDNSELQNSKPMWRSDMKDSELSNDEDSDNEDNESIDHRNKSKRGTKHDNSKEEEKEDDNVMNIINDVKKAEEEDHGNNESSYLDRGENPKIISAIKQPASSNKHSNVTKNGSSKRDQEWKVARSEAGKLYFYHRKTRKTQWFRPENGIIVNLKDFPELEQTIPSQKVSGKEDLFKVHEISAKNEKNRNLNKEKYVSKSDNSNHRTPGRRSDQETPLTTDPSRKLHFSSTRDHNSTDNSFASNKTNDNANILFDDPRSKISPSAVLTGRMFAIKQAAIVLLSASPSTVRNLHCPYCGDHVERKFFIAHLQGCECLSTYINASPSRKKDINNRTNNSENQQNHHSTSTIGTDGRFESKTENNTIKWGPDHIVTPSKNTIRPSTTPGYRTPIHEINRSSDNESEESKSNSSPGEVTLYPCTHCGRTFAESRLEVHERVCQRIFGEKRYQYDAVAKRTKGTPYRQNRSSGTSSYSVPQPPRIRRTRNGDGDEDSNVGGGIDTRDSMYLSPSDRAGSRNKSTGERKKYNDSNNERPSTTGSAVKMAQCPFCKCSTKKQDLSSHLLKCKHQKQSRNTVWGAAKERRDGRINWSQGKNSTSRRRHKLSETPSVRSVDLL